MHRSSSRRKRKPSNNYQGVPTAEEERLLKHAIELSKVDCQRDPNPNVPFGPTFYPTIEEFEAGPVKYIEKIRPVAEKHGICKIIPPSPWKPPFCVDMKSKKKFQTKKQLLYRLQEGISFDDGEEYTPEEYLKMANDFSTKWRNEHYPNHYKYTASQKGSEKQRMTIANMERDYWNYVETDVEEIEVEYGNDIDTSAYWSGFPLSEWGRCHNSKKKSANPFMKEPKFGTDEFYRESWWNVNNISNLPNSVLNHIKVGITGINVPWLYFGSLFSTFCWHNEDNYLYSINYNHVGAPKLWYGVPGTRKDAEGLERVFKNYLSMKMREVPDLLHHITTMFSPRLLQQGDIPVCKVVQYAGEFVITFPRSFHGGFSLGPNIGEAVNFATHDWLMHGADASERYRSFSRPSVFSHDRLTLTMANHLHEQTSYANCHLLYNELKRIISEELNSRKKLLDQGVRDISHEITLPKNRLDQLDNESADYDDKRLCHSCKHVCFFSAVACECSQSKVSCLRHSHYMCRCPTEKKYLLIWSKRKELVDFLEAVRNHTEKLKSIENKLRCTDKILSSRNSSSNTLEGTRFATYDIRLPVLAPLPPLPSFEMLGKNTMSFNYCLPASTTSSTSGLKRTKVAGGKYAINEAQNANLMHNYGNLERKMGLSTSNPTTHFLRP